MQPLSPVTSAIIRHSSDNRLIFFNIPLLPALVNNAMPGGAEKSSSQVLRPDRSTVVAYVCYGSRYSSLLTETSYATRFSISVSLTRFMYSLL